MNTSWIQRVRDWTRSDMRVLRWVFIGLYVLLLAAVFSGSISKILGIGDDPLIFVINIVYVGIAFLAQTIFILGGGTVRLCEPIKPRRLWMPVLIASIMMGLLSFGMLCSMLELFELHINMPEDIYMLLFFIFVGGNWIFWGILLWQFARKRPRLTALSRLASICFAGSLVELLAAIPSHIIVSRRPGCLVGMWTLLGIVAGILVMIFSFGPMILMLFLRPRYRREQMESATPTCPTCEYNLTGTLMAKHTTCPECGAVIPSHIQLPCIPAESLPHPAGQATRP